MTTYRLKARNRHQVFTSDTFSSSSRAEALAAFGRAVAAPDPEWAWLWVTMEREPGGGWPLVIAEHEFLGEEGVA